MANSIIYTVLDIKRAHYKILIAKLDLEKTAITTPFGLFKHVTMPFDLKTAAQMYQRFIDGLLSDLNFVYYYTDNILIASSNPGEHEKHVWTVSERLNPSKYIW